MNHFLVAALVVVALASADAVRSRGPPRGGRTLEHICDMDVGYGAQGDGSTPTYIHSEAGDKDACYKSCQRVMKRWGRQGKTVIGVTIFVGPEARRPLEDRSCACLIKEKGGMTIDPKNTDWRTCMLYKKGDPKPKIPVAGPPVCEGLGTKFSRKGCFAFAKRGKYLVNRRYEIEWSKAKHSGFACSFVQACAKAALAEGVPHFATHYWGECWEVQMSEGTAVPSGEGCSLADGNYQTLCKGTDLTHECLGSTNYYVYSTATLRVAQAPQRPLRRGRVGRIVA